MSDIEWLARSSRTMHLLNTAVSRSSDSFFGYAHSRSPRYLGPILGALICGNPHTSRWKAVVPRAVYPFTLISVQLGTTNSCPKSGDCFSLGQVHGGELTLSTNKPLLINDDRTDIYIYILTSIASYRTSTLNLPFTNPHASLF